MICRSGAAGERRNARPARNFVEFMSGKYLIRECSMLLAKVCARLSRELDGGVPSAPTLPTLPVAQRRGRRSRSGGGATAALKKTCPCGAWGEPMHHVLRGGSAELGSRQEVRAGHIEPLSCCAHHRWGLAQASCSQLLPNPRPRRHMFNCNLFLVSQCNPWLIPLVSEPLASCVGSATRQLACSLHAGPLYPPFSRMTGPAASRQVSLRDALPHWLGSFFESEVKHRCGVVAGQCKFGC